MRKFKMKLQWIWDYYFKSMKPSDYFQYMESKYGQKWYDLVDENYEEKFG